MKKKFEKILRNESSAGKNTGMLKKICKIFDSKNFD